MNKPRKGAGGQWVCDIDGHEYGWSKWGALKSLDVLSELSDLLGKPLGLLLGKMNDGQGLRTQLTGDVSQTVIAALTRRMRKNKKDVFRVLELLTATDVFCDGRPIRSMDTHYEDRIDHLFRVAYAGLEVQYGSFFAAVRDAVGLRPDAQLPDLTQASATSTG